MSSSPSSVITKNNQQYYRLNVCRSKVELPLFQVAPKVKIALFNMLGETKLIRKFAKELAKKLPSDTEVIITPEVKSVCLAYELSHFLRVPYVVARKTRKPYMVDSIGDETLSITTGKPQQIWLDGKDLPLVKGKKVTIIDDVISTGGTLLGMRRLIKKAKGKIIAEAAVFTEGDEKKWAKVISLGHLPIFND